MPTNWKGHGKSGCLLLLFALLVGYVNAQNPVTGRVINKTDNSPVAGATIQVKNTRILVQSAADGTFSVRLPRSNGVLIISAVGFAILEVPVAAGSAAGDISLTTTSTTLNDVVVTGYTAQRKADITGSVSVVNVADAKATPTGSTESLLQGQASGVTVFTTGQPGGGSVVQIRGITSSGNSAPLVIIDGVPESMHDINPNDIASIQVLKDAGAASIYGVRGSNGVIIITTKRGSGAVKVAYDGYYGTQRPLHKSWDLASPAETGVAKWAMAFNDGLSANDPQYGTGATPVLPYYITPAGAPQGAPNTSPADYSLYTNHITKADQAGNNWFRDIFKPAPIQDHNVSLSGGSGRSSYFMAFNYMDQQGTLIDTRLQRYSIRANTVFSFADDHVRIGENLFAFYKSNPGYLHAPGVNSTNSINAAYQIPNIIPVYDIAGNYAGTISRGLGNAWNPVAIQQRQANNTNHDYQAMGNVYADVDFLGHFTAHSSVGGTVDDYYFNGFATTPYENAENNAAANLYEETYGWNTSLVWTNTLKYANRWGRNDLSVLGGVEYIYNTGRAVNTTRGNYYITDSSNLTVSPNLWTLNFGQASTQTNNSAVVGDNGILTPYQLAIFSMFGRLDYNFDSKYLISATFRRDGSSVFVPAQRYGNFPAITAGWRISGESFMKNIDWINDLKIRGGWGKLGSISNINPTNAFTLYGQQINESYYDINGTSNSPDAGLYVSQYGNPKTSWEKDILTNVGLDATLLHNRIDFSIEWYDKLISGLLFVPQVPGTNGGAADPFLNSGNIRNTGVDVALTYHGIVNSDLKFDVGANFTTYNNKVVSLPAGTLYIDEPAGAQTITSRIQPGHPLGAFFGYKVAGIFQSWQDVASSPAQQDAAPGRFKYADVDHNGKIDANDRTFFGNPNPKFSVGVNISVNYRSWDFYTFLYASVGNDILNNVKSSTDFPQSFGNQISKAVALNSARLVNSNGDPTNINDSSAHLANPGTKIPMLEQSANFSNSGAFNSYIMEKGSFLRCRNLTVGYNIVSNGLRRVHFDKLRIYAQVLNLFTVTKYSGLDPELNPGSNTVFGVDGGVYPNNQKTYNL
ncbi:MAG TPA: SusC/RagA family TonB-linked outer membrane protein, partial [Puia sp.]|nr:SusC/RagA family TonB-linked outer membrane protein [Puia sp.]